ncbi:MAG TPA: cobyrinate a,c-diamide synthase [Terracidiphilus sp.]|nr:cobyrinate a,c-diamide synthase [Terracidiphilus sp.]
MIGFLVAGTASGVGKTTAALALMAASRSRGLVVQPFKCGPDFLDAGHHAAMCARPSHNLDSWMLSAEDNRALFASACRGADIAIVEGMMGLYDGAGGATDEGSTAEIAKLLGLPVVLVLEASNSARSIAAVVKGFEGFDPQLRFAGIILNGVSSEGHYRMLQDAIRTVTTMPLLGRIPHTSLLAIPERHLGLQTIEEENAHEQRSAHFCDLARQHLDLAPLLALSPLLSETQSSAIPLPVGLTAPLRIGVARDKAFSFYYADNLDLLRRHGAEILEFSPISDEVLPQDLDLLYLGGGYPELYAQDLSENRRMCDAVRSFAESGKPVYAECGGMLYLGQSLTAQEGRSFPMTGVLALEFEMTAQLAQFGYVEITLTHDCLLGRAGQTARGHSFHYSRLRSNPSIPTCYRLHYSLSGRDEFEGYRYKNVLASYIHLHFRSNPAIVPSLLEQARHCPATEVSA